MAEYARGGHVVVDESQKVVLPLIDNAYYLPPDFVKEWAKSVLDRINEELDRPADVVVD